MMKWNGGMEWNVESNGPSITIMVYAHIACSYHLSSYNRFLVCALGYCQGGDGLRGLEHSFAQSTS